MVILIYEGEFGVMQGGIACLREDGDLVVGLQCLIGTGADSSVELHTARTQQLLDAGNSHTAELGLHQVKQGCRRCGV